MIKIDTPPPKQKKTEEKPSTTRNAEIYKFSEGVLRELSEDDVPSIPNNYSIYFEKLLDAQSDEFRQKVGDVISIYDTDTSSLSDGNIHIEKEVRQGFVQIKSLLQAVALIYKNLNVMKAIMKKRLETLTNNTNLLAVSNTVTAFEGDLARLTQLMDKHLEVIKINYDEIGKMFKSIEERSIYDTTYEVYNKKFLVATLQSEIDSVKRYGYKSSFLLVKIRDEFAGRIKNLKERNNMLKSVSSLLLRTSRRSDTVAHYGDGCFAMVMKYTDEVGAKMACNRILAMLTSVPWSIDGDEYSLDVQMVAATLVKERSVEETLSNALDAFVTHKDEPQPIFLGQE